MPTNRGDDGAHGHATPPELSPIARRLLERVESDEPLQRVIESVVDSLDRLADRDQAELFTAIGRRHRRERRAGPATPESASGQG